VEHVDRVAQVERLTPPVGYRCPGVQDQSILRVPRAHGRDRIRWHGGWRRNVRDDPVVGPPELKRAARLALDLVALFVDRPVVPATEKREVGERRGAALGPVTDVVALAEPGATAREAATVIPMVERSP
jgi:hypothetical protein